MPLPPILKKWINAWLKDEGSENVKYDSDLDGKIDQLRTILRSDLEYPTEDVSFAYLLAIEKANDARVTIVGGGYATSDSFTDKAVRQCAQSGDFVVGPVGRHIDGDNNYHQYLRQGNSTSDHEVEKVEGGARTVIGSESVDIDNNVAYDLMFSISGSTLKGFREDMDTPKISVTDTTFSSGKFGTQVTGPGVTYGTIGRLLAPASPLSPAKVIIEAEIIGSGGVGDPFRPNFARLLDTHPEFGDIDRYAVTWGAFDHKPAHATMLITITADNPYQSGAIQTQIDNAKSKNLKVLKPPRDYAEAVEQYKTLKTDFPEWLAGKENFAYQTLGHEDIEPLAVADFYYGELIEHKTHYDQLKRVPDWEMERILKMWKERLERVTAVPTGRKELHLKKLKEVLRVGW